MCLWLRGGLEVRRFDAQMREAPCFHPRKLSIRAARIMPSFLAAQTPPARQSRIEPSQTACPLQSRQRQKPNYPKLKPLKKPQPPTLNISLAQTPARLLCCDADVTQQHRRSQVVRDAADYEEVLKRVVVDSKQARRLKQTLLHRRESSRLYDCLWWVRSWESALFRAFELAALQLPPRHLSPA